MVKTATVAQRETAIAMASSHGRIQFTIPVNGVNGTISIRQNTLGQAHEISIRVAYVLLLFGPRGWKYCIRLEINL